MSLVWIVPGIVLLACAGAGVAYRAAGRETRALDAAERERLGGSYVTLPAGVTHYELTGPEDGRLVVLIHGVTVPLWTWDPQVGALTEAGFRVLRYDLLGRGWSDRPNTEYTRALYRRQLEELLDALAMEGPVDIVGHSFGAMAAAEFTAANRSRVRRLVLISPPNDPARDRTPLGALVRAGRMPIVGPLAVRLHIVPRSVRRVEELMRESSVDRERCLALYRRQIAYRGFEQALLSLFRGDAVGDYTHAYREAGEGREVLIVWGNQDTNVTRDRVEEVFRAVPQAVFRELNDVGHQPNWQVPAQLNDIVVDFLRGEDCRATQES